MPKPSPSRVLRAIFSGAIFSGGILCCSAHQALAQGPNVKWRLEDSDVKSHVGHFTVPEGYHFNVEAPSKASALASRGTFVTSEKIEIKGRNLNATWSQTVDLCHVKATLFVCDDKNTFCISKKQEINCDHKNLNNVEISNPERAKPEVLGTGGPGRVAETFAGFIDNDSIQALKAAQTSHRPLLIDFYGIWCPPCNQLNETVFNTKAFEKASERFVLLKLDADTKASWELKSRYKVSGYPTVIFASESGSEIFRIVGARDADYFVSQMNRLSKSRNEAFDELQLKADTALDAAYRLGHIYLERGDFEEAYTYLLRASRGWSKTDGRNNKLLAATLGIYSKDQQSIEGKKRYARLLKDVISWYPHAEEAFDRGEELARVSDSLGDKEIKNWARESQLHFCEYYLKNQKDLRSMDFTVSSLYESLGDVYEDLGLEPEARKWFTKAASSYLNDIQLAKLDQNNERAYNLERIYCIWKSGQADEASKWYEKFESLYPNEFTFYYQHAKLLQSNQNLKEALAKSEKALKTSYGDNRLRVFSLTAEILEQLNEKKRALKILDEGIAQAELPTDKSIRTYRYYDKLKTLKKKFGESGV